MTNSKRFYDMVVPSIGASLVTALYVVVDGIFVGRGVGSQGLAAVNMSIPFVAILTSVSMMLSMGGATLTSISFGKGDFAEANRNFNTTLKVIIYFSLGMTLMSLFFSEEIAWILGTTDLLLKDTADYIKYYVMFGVFFCASMSLAAFIRNDGNPRLAFIGMIVGAVSNIFLDWLFIFVLHMGIKGAAIASGLGQIMACIVLLLHFTGRKGKLVLQNIGIDRDVLREITKIGLPEFITQMNQPVTILCYNLVVMRVFGEIGIAAFSVVGYLIIITLSVFIGVSQGIQPLISKSFGEGNIPGKLYFFKKGVILNTVLSVLINILMVVFGVKIISIFNSDSELIKIAYECIGTYGISFIFAAVNIVYTTYYLSTKKTKEALIVAFLRSFVFNTLFIFTVPAILGKSGIWLGIILAELTVMFICIFLNKKEKRYMGSC